MKDKIRVLIVDDHILTLHGLRALLATEPNIEVVGEATDGADAIRFVTGDQPDVVLMDVQMPVMDGLEATQEIKLRWPKVKVILHTVYSFYEKGANQAGADYFLLKGCSSKALFDTIFALSQTSPTLELGRAVQHR